jgi:crotonobetainyl-CoA:carnitine CoA-transferase CaiB-like acyl-CoA transferase
MQISMEHPAAGAVPMIANPIRFREEPIEYKRPPPVLGQHTQEVLGDLLGLAPEAIDGLRAKRVI